ncbi:MAG: tRNA pseudouridine(55) synthase TruB [Pseudomonadota bacterium]
MARKNRGRNVSGVILLDKPLGITSNDALQKVKRLYFAAKAGHTGSLDPMASGMLPVCFGEATKLSQFLLEEDKCYEVEGTLGFRTETGDAEGQIVSEREVNLSHLNQLETVLDDFRGQIMQVPSMFSALKHNGTPLYKLARQGIIVERAARQISIYELNLLSVSDNKFRLFVNCSKGTYIRSLVEDIGEKLGCGAHVSYLRRVSVGGFQEEQMIPFNALQSLRDDKLFSEMDDQIIPLIDCLPSWPEVKLDPSSAFYFNQGQPVLVTQIPEGNKFKVLGAAGELLGVAEIDNDGKLAPKRLVKA